MFKRIKQWFKSLFETKSPAKKVYGVSIGDKVGNVIIASEAQQIKHTKYEPGESYRLGEMIVTVHKDKASMLAAIKAVDDKREARHKALTERGIDLILMTPEQLLELKIEEWLKKRNEYHQGLKFWGKKEAPGIQPSGNKTGRFQQLMEAIKTKEKA